MLRRLTAATVVLTLLATGAACGGDDDDADGGGGGGDTLTAAEWREQADAICAAHAAAIEGQEVGASPSAADIEAFVDEVVAPNIQGQIDEIAALTPPEELQEDVDELLEAAREGLETYQALPAAELIALQDDPFAEVNQMAADLGLEDCAGAE